MVSFSLFYTPPTDKPHFFTTVTATFGQYIYENMKVVLCVFVLVAFINTAMSQYYFTDIVSHRQSDYQYKQLVAAKVTHMKAVSYGKDSTTISKTFSLEQNIMDGGKKVIAKTTLANSGTTIIENNYNNSQLVTSLNSIVQPLSTITTKTEYLYSDQGTILAIISNSMDTIASVSGFSEKHLWQYNHKNKPTQMLNIKNNKDTLKVSFSYDEKGNVAEEKWNRSGAVIENYYYYYDEDGLLTDVVRYNNRVRKLLPDFVYEYDENANIIKMTQTIKGGTDYFIWKYTYNDKNLKATESCYTRKNELQGKVVYAYSY